MSKERLTIIHGPLAGSEFLLSGEETFIGRSPTGDITLDEPDVAWRHCAIRREDGRAVLFDLQTGRGTFVNGVRVARHALEPHDQIAVGGTVLIYEPTASAGGSPDTKPTLLRASALQFLFRALAQSQGQPHQRMLEEQLLRLVADLLPCPGLAGMIALGRSPAELAARSAEYGSPAFPASEIEALARAACQGEPAVDERSRGLAVPLYVTERVGGVIVLKIPAAEAPRFAEHFDTLTAVVSLASVALESAREVEALREQKALLEEQIGGKSGILGESPPIRRLLQMVDRVAPTGSTGLSPGERGTGKELGARALHERSPRRAGPFVAINCAALASSLLESELFGHEKGAFTGAVAEKKGRLEVAEGGTVFLDEIGEMASALQAKMLRVLEQREMVHVGGHRVVSLDVRVIAATNRDLAAEVKRGAFREDLYHRLNVIALRTPPLRERKEDIPALARHFVARSAALCNRRVTRISPDAERALAAYDWPGNVRELENAIERAVVLGESDAVQCEDLPESLFDAAEAPGGGYQDSVGTARRESILRAYEQGGGDYKAAAKILGIHPNYLLRLVRNLGLKEKLGRAARK